MSALCKNGLPRKSGSGRTKGAVSLVSVKLSTLVGKFKPDDLIVCGRIFLKKAGIDPDCQAISAPISAELRAGIQIIEV